MRRTTAAAGGSGGRSQQWFSLALRHLLRSTLRRRRCDKVIQAQLTVKLLPALCHGMVAIAAAADELVCGTTVVEATATAAPLACAGLARARLRARREKGPWTLATSSTGSSCSQVPSLDAADPRKVLHTLLF
jgi:hypothetical protein